ncbi:MAG: hypothetical protein KJ734_04965, partial [Chloroflexi bacterium]|nr:hypothetical protein [Chloroflexota bacterium]
QTGTAGTFTPLNPNRRIAAVPYALRAEKAKTAATASDADTVDGQHGSAFAAAGTVWSLTGNAGTTPGTHFIGTTGNQALVFKTNGTEWLRLDTQGRLGLGATTLAATLHLQRNGPVSILADSTADSYASLDLRSNGQTWQWSKRPSGQGDRLELYYHNGTSWSGPWLAIEPTGIIRVANQVVSTVGTGTAPLAVNSKTQVNNLNADLLDGQHASAFQQHYANVVIVANSGGDYTTITAALNSISGESDANRYLVKVMPGVYTEQVTMKPYVDIEGAGELVTKITYTGDSTTATTGTVVGANNAELRFLTVENTGANAFAIAIRNSSASPRLTHVTATASGGTSSNHGVYNSSSSPTMTDVTAIASGSTGTYNYGVFNGAATVTMLNVTAKASGGAQSFGVRNQVATVTMINVTATASGGTTNYGVYNWAFSGTHEVRISNSQVTGTNYGVYNSQNGGTGSYTVEVNNSQVSGSTTIRSDTSCTTRLGASRLSGGAVDTSSGGTVTCYACYDENYTNAGGVNVCP